jgi:hypothetical protein
LFGSPETMGRTSHNHKIRGFGAHGRNLRIPVAAFPRTLDKRQQGRAETSCCGLYRNSRIPASAFAITSKTSFSQLVARTWELSRRLPHFRGLRLAAESAFPPLPAVARALGGVLSWLQKPIPGLLFAVGVVATFSRRSPLTSESPRVCGGRFLAKYQRPAGVFDNMMKSLARASPDAFSRLLMRDRGPADVFPCYLRNSAVEGLKT